jgi:hypothetical protein
MHNVDIVFTDKHASEWRYSGTIDNTRLESALKMITLTSPVTYKIKEGVVYLSSDKTREQKW